MVNFIYLNCYSTCLDLSTKNCHPYMMSCQSLWSYSIIIFIIIIHIIISSISFPLLQLQNISTYVANAGEQPPNQLPAKGICLQEQRICARTCFACFACGFLAFGPEQRQALQRGPSRLISLLFPHPHALVSSVFSHLISACLCHWRLSPQI